MRTTAPATDLLQCTPNVTNAILLDDTYSSIYLSLQRMLRDEQRISCMNDEDKEYINDCANPIIIQLCKSGLENLRLAVKRCQAASMVLTEHKSMNILHNMEKGFDDSYELLPDEELSAKQDTCQRQRLRVTDMINIARVVGETQYSSTNIKNFYATLAPGSVSPTLAYYRRRRSKRPRRLIEEK